MLHERSFGSYLQKACLRKQLQLETAPLGEFHVTLLLQLRALWGLVVFYHYPSRGGPGGASGKEPTCNVGDLGLIPGSDPWVRKILWRREWQPIPVFLHGESHGQRILVGYKVTKSRTCLKWLSRHVHPLNLLEDKKPFLTRTCG